MVMIMIVFTAFLWPAIHGVDMQIYPGDIKIGALFSIREKPDPSDPSLKCGKIREVHGIQKLESALLALDQINSDPHLLPGVRLGMEVRDTCWSEILALRQSLCLIRGKSIMSIPDYSRKPNEDHGMIAVREKMVIEKPSVVGVIGPATAEQSMQVQNLLKLLNIPQIGYSDTMEKLADRIEYPTFLRGAPCDSYHSTVIRDILIEFNWKFVATVYTREAYGEAIRESFHKLLERGGSHVGICIAADRVIEPHFGASDIDTIILDLNDNKSVNVIVCFCEREALRLLFKAAKRLNLTSRFTFIASDGWGDVDRITHGVEEQAWGTIFIQIHTPGVPQFMKYYTSLKPETNTRNPWFREFWEDKFNCTLPIKGVTQVETNVKTSYNPCGTVRVSRQPCTGNESLSDHYHEHRKIYFVMSAVTTMAAALHNMIAETCGYNYSGLCSEIQQFDTSKLVDHLMDISYSFNNFTSFEHGKPPPRYTILNFQKLPNDTFKWIKIGNWNNYMLKLHQEFQNREDRNSTSICSLPCSIGHHKSFARNSQNRNCCWSCELCNAYEYVSFDQDQCIECPLGERPNATRTGCDKIPIPKVRWDEPMIIMIATLAVSGLVGTLFTFHIFVKYKDTPMVKASNLEFSYLMLASISLAYISVFGILAEPTRFFCALSRTLPGVSLTMMYAGLFTEMNRIARITMYSKNEFPQKKPRFVSISSQFAITFLCVAIETAICFAMILASPSAPITDHRNRDQPYLTCSDSIWDVIPPLIQIVFLHALCIVYTFKTRNIPGNFNEAKFMGFAMLISFVTWIVFVTVYFGTEIKGITMSFCLTLFPSFILIFLFFPKLYIIIFKPEKNNIALLKTSRSMKAKIGSQSTVDSAGSMCESPVCILGGNDSPSSGRSCKLRRSIAIQTSSELLRNMILEIALANDGESSRDDGDFGVEHDGGNIVSDCNEDIVSTVEDSLEKKNNSCKNTFASPEEFSCDVAANSPKPRLNSLPYKAGMSFNDDRSATLLSESCLELNVNGLLQLGSNWQGDYATNL